MSKPDIERIKLDPKSCEGHTFRYCYRGPGSAAFHIGGVDGREINYSEFSHFNEAQAKGRRLARGVDWPAFMRLCGKIRYHIRSRLSVQALPGHAVLPEAMEWAKKGHVLVRHALLQWRYSSKGLKK